jgi:hypothetical protein
MTATDPIEGAVMHPSTGEVVSLDAPLEDLAAYLADVRDWEQTFLRPCKRAVEDEILRRLDHDASYTQRVGDFEIRGDGPGRVTYQEEVLRGALRPLVDDGTISRAAFNAAVKEEVVYTPVVRGINALKKLGGAVTAAVESAARPSHKPRRVTVKHRGRL